MRLAVLMLSAVLAACSGIEMKPGEVSHARREIPPGPGLLSGPDGEFVIYRQGAAPAPVGSSNEEPGSEEPDAP